MTLSEFFHNQMATWPETAARYDDLARVEVRDFGAVSAQYNPARMVSTGAKVDKKTLAQRPCFLCKDHRPEIQQEWAFGEDFDVLVNPKKHNAISLNTKKSSQSPHSLSTKA